ncbi:prepilin peptidase [Microbacterium sp. JZ31]|uniref:prepilin peptidase n=1 Tax=Microbacterium sp. JZ31 TaxID=1906274 RepID=UPI001933DC56|nr:A24 family peptidase [Microbacterium sp. JZ31]
MIPLVATGSGALGLAIGSFLNVVAWRVPRGESVVAPASACPKCGHAIRPHDNVPVLSWLLLRGKCRDCGARISPRYPIVEAITGALFVLVAVTMGPALVTAPSASAAWAASLELVAFLALAGFGVALAAIDLDTHRLPNALVYPLLVTGALLLGLAALIEGDGAAALRAGAGAIALCAVYLAIVFVKPGGMGLGDVKLALPLGLFLGWTGWGALAVGFIAAFALGAVIGLVLILTRRIERRGGIPFGPWMIAGAWIGILCGNGLASAYLALFGLG